MHPAPVSDAHVLLLALCGLQTNMDKDSGGVVHGGTRVGPRRPPRREPADGHVHRSVRPRGFFVSLRQGHHVGGARGGAVQVGVLERDGV